MSTLDTRLITSDPLAAAVFPETGELGALCRALDWSATPLGPIAGWPPALRTMAAVVVAAPLPMLLLWGPDLVQIYNDGYRDIMAARHPGGLGQRTNECWPEVGELTGPIYQRVLLGEPVAIHDRHVLLERRGYPEEACFTFTCSPVPAEGGGVAGVLVTVFETTAAVRAREELQRAETALHAAEERVAADLELARHLQALSARVGGELQELAEQILDAAMALMRSDSACMQILEPADVGVGRPAVLHLLANRGFHPASTGFWERISLDSAACCAQALSSAGRTVVADVETDPSLVGTPDLEEYRRSGIRAVQSTPLVSSAGRSLGVISTLWHEPHRPSEEEFLACDILARQAADLVARSRAEQALGRSETRVRRMGNVDGVGVLLFDVAVGTLLDANDAFLEMFGYDREDVTSGRLTWQMMTPPEYVEISLRELDKLAATGRIGPYEKEYLRKDGSRTWMVFAGAALGDGTLIEYSIDINDRKKAEAALALAASTDAFRVRLGDALRPLSRDVEIQAAATRVLREHLHATRALYAELSPDGRSLRVEADSADDGDSIVGDHQLSAFSPLMLQRLAAGETAVVADIRAEAGFMPGMLTAQEALGVRAFLVAPLVKQSRFAALLAVLDQAPRAWAPHEIALVQEAAERTWAAVARARADAAILEARDAAEKANLAKSQFLSTLSHELRTPLTAIIGMTDLLGSGVVGAVTEKQQQFLDRVKAGAWQLASIIDDILTFARAEAGKEVVRLESADVAAIARDVVTLMGAQANAAGITLGLLGADAPVIVRSDGGKLRQILLNLVGNALKYSRTGSVDVEVEAGAAAFELRVRDTGPGIPPERLEEIFEPFVQLDGSPTREAGGTGLGLTICRRLARLMGGDVTVQSNLGVGSTFTLRLPASAPDPAA